MIFITLGSQKFQFNRLLQEVDRLIEKGVLSEEVFAQCGYSDYKPRSYISKEFLNREEFLTAIKVADIVITHGGTGAIITAVKEGKKVIAVPRLAKYGEHVDDHQLQLLQQFGQMGIIEVCYNLNKLYEVIKRAREKQYRQYVSSSKRIIDSIERFITEQETTSDRMF